MTISIFKPRSDVKLEKGFRALATLLQETAGIHDCLDKMIGLIQQSRESLATLSSAQAASLSAQIEMFKKMEKFYETQIKWAEEQEKLVEQMKSTEDDLRY